jgi:large subunit ribosomal protein L3
MGKRHTHKKGSVAYRPRKRAINQMPRVNFWPPSTEKKLLGFAGYKAGMTTISYIDDSTSPNAGNEVFIGATIIEAPPMTVYGVRGMRRGINAGDIICADEKLLAPLHLKKKKSNELKPENIDEVFVLAYASPSLCNFGKKSADAMMIAVGGKDIAEKLEYAKSLLGKQVKASEALKAGDYVDSVSVTKGKGWQGAVKRFGTSVQRRKATGKRRHIGTLGAWHPGYVQYTVPMAGQTGYHKRTESNKRVMKILSAHEANPSGGFMHYGPAQNECILIHGSVGGPAKRLIRLRKAARKPQPKVPDLKSVSLVSKQ